MEKGSLHWFSLTETRQDVARIMGQPRSVSRLGEDLEAWQYQIGVSDEHEFSHQLVFRRSTGELISATRLFEVEHDVDWLFADGQDSVYWYKNPAGPDYGVRLTRLSGNRLLVVPGSVARGKPASQILLIRASELRSFFPWLADEIEEPKTQQK